MLARFSIIVIKSYYGTDLSASPFDLDRLVEETV